MIILSEAERDPPQDWKWWKDEAYKQIEARKQEQEILAELSAQIDELRKQISAWEKYAGKYFMVDEAQAFEHLKRLTEYMTPPRNPNQGNK